MDNEVLKKLADNFDDLKERLIRIEEGLKFVRAMEEDVDEAKRAADAAQRTADEALLSTRSAHKRIDSTENNQTWLWRTIVGAVILGVITFVFFQNGGS